MEGQAQSTDQQLVIFKKEDMSLSRFTHAYWVLSCAARNRLPKPHGITTGDALLILRDILNTASYDRPIYASVLRLQYALIQGI